MKTHEDFMRMAIALSENNVVTGNGGPFGAVIVKDGELLAQSANMVVPQNDPTAHAEISAIRLACKELNTFNLQGAVIYTSCEPCPMCLGAIYWAKIKEVYFANTKKDAANIGFDDHFIYDELEKPMAYRRMNFTHLLRDEALQAFKLWEASDRKISY
jgi:tRNA(Arg) A34 adenosine deaminase TadA